MNKNNKKKDDTSNQHYISQHILRLSSELHFYRLNQSSLQFEHNNSNNSIGNFFCNKYVNDFLDNRDIESNSFFNKIENFISKKEKIFANIIKNIRKNEKVNETDYINLKNFLIMQIFRNDSLNCYLTNENLIKYTQEFNHFLQQMDLSAKEFKDSLINNSHINIYRLLMVKILKTIYDDFPFNDFENHFNKIENFIYNNFTTLISQIHKCKYFLENFNVKLILDKNLFFISDEYPIIYETGDNCYFLFVIEEGLTLVLEKYPLNKLNIANIEIKKEITLEMLLESKEQFITFKPLSTEELENLNINILNKYEVLYRRIDFNLYFIIENYLYKFNEMDINKKKILIKKFHLLIKDINALIYLQPNHFNKVFINSFINNNLNLFDYYESYTKRKNLNYYTFDSGQYKGKIKNSNDFFDGLMNFHCILINLKELLLDEKLEDFLNIDITRCIIFVSLLDICNFLRILNYKNKVIDVKYNKIINFIIAIYHFYDYRKILINILYNFNYGENTKLFSNENNIFNFFNEIMLLDNNNELENIIYNIFKSIEKNNNINKENFDKIIYQNLNNIKEEKINIDIHFFTHILKNRIE